MPIPGMTEGQCADRGMCVRSDIQRCVSHSRRTSPRRSYGWAMRQPRWLDFAVLIIGLGNLALVPFVWDSSIHSWLMIVVSVIFIVRGGYLVVFNPISSRTKPEGKLL